VTVTTTGGRTGLRRELAQAEKRLLAEVSKPRGRQQYPASARIIEVEERRILILSALIEAGRGHVFTSQTNWADRPSYLWTGRDIPACRHCRVPVIGDLAAKEPCSGDRHACPWMISERRGRAVCCGEPGRMGEDFTAWECVAGHVTGSRHVPLFWDHARLCPLAGDSCPWPFLA
jgi:hypothetical protein